MNESANGLRITDKKRWELLGLEILVLSFLTVTVAILLLIEQRYLILFFLLILTSLFSVYIINKQRELKRLDAELTEEQLRNIEEKIRNASVQERLTEVTMLYKAGRITVSSMTLQRKLDKMLHLAYGMVNASRASIMLINERMGTFVIASTIGIDVNQIIGSPQRIDEGVAGWVCENKTPIILTGRVSNARFHNFREKTEDISSAICLPVKLRGKVIGVLNLSYINDPDRLFTEHDMRLLSVISRYVSTAIEQTQISLKKQMVHT